MAYQAWPAIVSEREQDREIEKGKKIERQGEQEIEIEIEI